MILNDVRVKKANVIIKRLMTMILLVHKELKKSLSAHKVPSIFQSLNTIAVQQEYDPNIDVLYNGSMLRGVLMDGGASVNVITILAMIYTYFEIERLLSIISKNTNKKIYKLQYMISNVCINI